MADNISELQAFVAVATDLSFTRAAARLGIGHSSLSRTIRNLEEQIGVRLLTRTTRSVSLTEAGERLLGKIGPRLEEIAAELKSLSDLRDTPSGTVRITCPDQAVDSVWPRLMSVVSSYPEINVELFADNSFTDIAAERFDAGVRIGESLEKDMIAVRIGPDLKAAAVASPAYFEQHPRPVTPQDLIGHNCINLRLSTRGELYAWEFEKDGRSVRIRVHGQLIFNTVKPMVEAATAGLGLAYVPEDSVRELIETAKLVSVLEDWCQPVSGLHLYYPNRRQNSSAFQIVVEALRYRHQL